jgi:hypothetical protein
VAGFGAGMQVMLGHRRAFFPGRFAQCVIA